MAWVLLLASAVAVLLTGLIDANDVFVVERGASGRLVHKSIHEFLFYGKIAGKKFERHFLACLVVFSEINTSHGSLPQ
jgi:hypothetical protein